MEPPRIPPWAQAEPERERLYALTGGRTEPKYPLRLETLLTATDTRSDGWNMAPEASEALRLCREEVRPVAEIAGLLARPVHITKIILSDLIDSGHLALPAAGAAGDHDHLLERCLVGLHTYFADAS
ncbi:DUF742 domain-containing protein [Streptomyces sp. NPDC001787]|uniref:DUF742 domain-containing protein n=1 Tax=Streptomyces sp. NPDC001787 TaxID=3154523 RepID=UPI0033255BF9